MCVLLIYRVLDMNNLTEHIPGGGGGGGAETSFPFLKWVAISVEKEMS